MKIAFFIFEFPVLSETFVLNELIQLQENGVSGTIFREKEGQKNHVHTQYSKLSFPEYTAPSKILSSATLPALILNHWWWLRTFPKRYFQFLTHWRFHLHSLEHFRIFLKSPTTARKVFQENHTHLYVHEHDSAFHYALATKELCQLPLICIFHTYYLFHKKSLLSEKIRQSNTAIFQSEYSRAYVLSSYPHLKKCVDKLTVVSSPGIDMDFFTFASRNFQRKKIQILAVGRLAEAKGFIHLLKALSLLHERKIPFHCTLVGDGEERKKIEQFIVQHNLEQQVTLTGALFHSPELIQLFHTSDIFVLPSVIDSDNVRDVHPNVIKEAMATGLLTLTSRLGGIDEVITDMKNGFLLPDPKKYQDFANHLLEVHSLSPDQKRTISYQANKKIAQDFSAHTITQKLITVFDKTTL